MIQFNDSISSRFALHLSFVLIVLFSHFHRNILYAETRTGGFGGFDNYRRRRQVQYLGHRRIGTIPVGGSPVFSGRLGRNCRLRRNELSLVCECQILDRRDCRKTTRNLDRCGWNQGRPRAVQKHCHIH